MVEGWAGWDGRFYTGNGLSVSEVTGVQMCGGRGGGGVTMSGIWHRFPQLVGELMECLHTVPAQFYHSSNNEGTVS